VPYQSQRDRFRFLKAERYGIGVGATWRTGAKPARATQPLLPFHEVAQGLDSDDRTVHPSKGLLAWDSDHPVGIADPAHFRRGRPGALTVTYSKLPPEAARLGLLVVRTNAADLSWSIPRLTQRFEKGDPLGEPGG
jgi:hypothetical protein